MSIPFLYRRLAYVALNVSDLQRSKLFYRDMMGLDVSSEDEGRSVAMRCDTHAMSLALYQSESVGLRRVGFQLASLEDLHKAREFFCSKGLDVWDVPESEKPFLKIDQAFRVLEPETGITFEFFDNMIEPGEAFVPRLAKIQRLGHVVIRTTRLDECWASLAENFGLLPSDYVVDKAVWARCYPNPLHHSFALVGSEEDGLHHVNFMVSELDDVGRARNRLLDAGVEIVFGPGRHKPSGSVFLYFLDPDGMTAEFSFGMEEFPVEGARQPRMLENSARTMDLWGGRPKPQFSNKGVIAGPDK